MKRTLLFLLFLSLSSYADLLLDRMIFDFDNPSKKKEDLWVTNSSDKETLYVEISIDQILNAGDYPLQRKTIKNPAESDIVVTPRKLALPPGTKKLVRYMLSKPLNDKEKIYRVQVVPKIGSVNLKKLSSDGKSTSESEDSKNIGLKVMVGYDTLVMVRPLKMNPDFKFIRSPDKKKVVAENKGNTNVLIIMLEQCEEIKKKDSTSESCEKIAGDRLYPGKKLEFSLTKPQLPVKIYHKIGDNTQLTNL